MTENKLSRIIVGTDFNELSTAALRFAAGIASRSGAALTVVYADTFEPPAEFTATQVRQIAERIERSKIRARDQLLHYVAHHVPNGVTWKGVIADGAPATTIAKIAETEDADFITLGTHGRGGLQRLVIGSVAEAVMREARAPVLTVRSAAAPGSIRRVLCPVNASDISALAVDHAARLARSIDAELTLLHVSAAGDSARLDMEALMPAGVRTAIIHRQIAHDDPAAEILAAEDGGAFDLIVIGAEHKLVRDVTLFGTTTAAVTRHARTPVLTVTRHAARRESISQGVETHVV